MTDLHLLRVFCTVARQGSVSAAARELHYVQPNISARVAQLESALGVPLFHRQSRGMILTPEGQTLLPHAERLLREASMTESMFKTPETFSGVLRIGTTDSFAATRLPDYARIIRAALPQAQLIFETEESRHLLEGAAAHELDGAFVEIDPSHNRVESFRVAEEELFLAYPPDAELRDHVDRSVLVSLLESRPLIVFPEGCSYREGLEKWCADANVQPGSLMEFRGIDAVLGCVEAGVGISVIPQRLAERSRFDVALLRFPGPHPLARTWWVRPRGSAATGVGRKLSECVLGAVKAQEVPYAH